MKTKLYSTLKVVVTVIGVAVLMQLNTVVYADESYSSVATTSGWAFGAGVGYSSRHGADARALSECRSRGKGQCSIEHRFRGAGCVAFAMGRAWSGAGAPVGAWGSMHGYSNNRSATQKKALRECHSRAHSCDITDTFCTES